MSGWLRRILPRGAGARLAGVCVALALCGVAQWYIRQRQHWGVASELLAISVLAAGLFLGKPEPAPERRAAAAGGRRSRSVLALGLVLAVAGLGALATASALLSRNWVVRFDRAAPLAIAGTAVWSVGLALVQRGRDRRAVPLPMPRWEWLAFVAIVALGVFLRFYRSDVFPPQGVCAVEEPQSGMGAHAILHAGARPWEFVGDRWLPVPFFVLMGENLRALRLPFMLVSALTIIPLYGLMRQLVSRQAALFATALFAMCSWHLIYARLAHAIFPTTLIVVLVLYLCARVHRRGGLAPYPWIGFLSAYTLYAYAGYRATTLLVVVFLGVSLGVSVRRWRAAIVPRFRAQARGALLTQCVGLLCAGVAFVAAALPLVFLLRANPQYYLEAAHRAVIGNPQYYTSDLRLAVQQRIDRLRDTAEMFNHLGDGAFTFNLPGEPMLDPVSGVLFPIGLAYTLLWWRHRLQGFFAFAFLFLLLMGTVFVHNFDIRRLQGIIPLIFVLIAFAADRLQQLGAEWRRGRARPALLLAALALAVTALGFNYDLYFRRMMNDQKVIAGFHNRYTLDIAYLHSLPPDAYLLVVGDTLNLFSPSDYAWWRGDEVPGSAVADLLPLLRGQAGKWDGHDLRVLIEQPFEREALGRLLQERFPGTRCENISQFHAAHLDYTVCRVPTVHSGRGFIGGARARYFRRDASTPFLERTEPVVSYAITPVGCQEPQTFDKGLCRAEWEGTWEVPQTGTYQVKAEGRQASVSLVIDGERVDRPAVTLSAGPHDVRVEAQSQSHDETGTRLLWRRNETEPWQLVRFARFAGEDGARPPAAAPAAEPLAAPAAPR
jgi:hypothetical protein